MGYNYIDIECDSSLVVSWISSPYVNDLVYWDVLMNELIMIICQDRDQQEIRL
ncbi:unnamed protein product, partial [Ilex paraguariensis]